MDFVLTILVLVLALAALAYPLYRAQTRAVMVNASTLDDLLAQRDGVYATLRDLELDQQLGKLDSSDYNNLRERYMLRATEILQELDVLRGEGSGQAASAEIEQEVAVMRHGKTNDEGRRTKDERRTTKDEPRATKDGGRTTKDERRASKDEGRTTNVTSTGRGAIRTKEKNTVAEMFCANCGRPYKTGDKFCARCGKALG